VQGPPVVFIQPRTFLLTSLVHSRRALQLHPTVPALYILSATHELDHLSPGGARTLLQRGLRLNSDSTELWTEYVKMELTFVESLRRRWEILGISVDKGKGKADDITEGEEASGNQENVDRDLEAQASADAARDEILDGAIVKSVLSNAVSSQFDLSTLHYVS
jgi:U3 small nucleolar RNA-associated protein 6